MKKMSKGMLMTALICGAVYLGGSPVYANELQEFALDEYVVTAARTETKLVDTPANISVVDAQTIEERHYQDVSEVLKDVPGANVIDSGAGAFEKKIILNGDERVLIMVDGRRLNFDMGTMTRSGYDMNQLPDVSLIERIEVLKGAGGALYGSDAVGGVVNIITKKADGNFGKVSVAIGSMGAEDYNAVYSIKENKTGISVAASKYEQDYYKYRDADTNTTKRWLGKSNFKDEKISLKLDQEITSTSSLLVGYDYSKFEGFKPNDSKSVGDSTNAINKKTKNIYAKYNWIINDNDRGYLQYYNNELDYYFYSNMVEKTDGIDLQQEITTSDVNKLVIGSSWRESKVTNPSAYIGENKINNKAFFVNDSWCITNSWILNSGVRYDDHSKAGDETTLSAGLNKKFDENSHIYLNWGQVFRTPTTDDYFYNQIGEDWEAFGDPNLKPETGETWTIGYQSKLNEKTDFGINYFESDLNDAIDWDFYTRASDGKEISEVSNVYKQKKRGLELSLQHKLNNHVDIEASYTYVNVQNDYNDGMGYVRDIGQVPNIYRLGISYHEGKWNANAWLRYGSGCDTSTVTVKDVIYGEYTDSNYLTVDLAVTYKATNNLSFYAKGYNLFNEAYAEQSNTTNGSYDYPAQSRRFIVGAEYKF